MLFWGNVMEFVICSAYLVMGQGQIVVQSSVGSSSSAEWCWVYVVVRCAECAGSMYSGDA